MKVVITGATGFVGRNVARYLVRECGVEVAAIARIDSNVADLTSLTQGSVQIHRVQPDVGSFVRSLEEVKPDVVVHIASMFRAAHVAEEAVELVESNIAYPIGLVEAMAHCGITRFVSTGTSWQHYGNHIYDPVNLYAATKEGFAAVCRYYEKARGLRSLVLELTDTYGPLDTRGKIVSVLLAAQHRGGSVAMSGGEQVVDLVHVWDVARAFATAVRSVSQQESERTVYAISSDAPIRLKDLVRIFEEARNCRLRIAWGALPYRDREMFQPIRVRERLPGWNPEIMLRDGLAAL